MNDTDFFNASGGGDPVMFQHLFWFFGHPEMLMLLCQFAVMAVGLGILIWHLAHRRRYGLLGGVVALTVVGVVSLVLFVQRTYRAFGEGVSEPMWQGADAGAIDWLLTVTQSSHYLLFGIAICTIIVAIFRSGLMGKILSNSVGALFIVSGVLLMVSTAVYVSVASSAADDTVLHDTYYVMAQAQYMLSPLIGFAIGAAAFYAFRPIVGVEYNMWLGLTCWANFTAGIALFVIPSLFITLQGMPRRYIDYAETFEAQAALSARFVSAGVFVTLLSLVFFAICWIEAIYRRSRNGKDVTPI